MVKLTAIDDFVKMGSKEDKFLSYANLPPVPTLIGKSQSMPGGMKSQSSMPGVIKSQSSLPGGITTSKFKNSSIKLNQHSL